jgi:site-specific recombinase XerD
MDMEGAAHLVLADGVSYVDPQKAVFEAMLTGWERQQRSRFLRLSTIQPRLRLVRRLVRFCDLYPWQWTPEELEAFTASLLGGEKSLTHSTIRGYHLTFKLFCAFASDARYGWTTECERRFGQAPVQVCHEFNTVDHVNDYEGRPGRRALTYDEVQALFDAADDRVEQIRRLGRKGVLAATRDAALLKTIYAFGLRRSEAVGLDVADFHSNPQVSHYGRFGSAQVRWGKATRGGPPRRRTVLTVPEMEWIVEVLRHYADQVRPAFSPADHPAMWITERRGRIQARSLDTLFAELRAPAGLPTELDLHCLRHAHITHLLEFGYPELFVQKQAGHTYAATTSIYSWVGDEYRNRMLQASLDRQLNDGDSA